MSKPGTRPDAHSALLQAALDELVEQGVAAVSLRAVARRAGLSHAAPGYFFGDRSGMLTALAAKGFAELADELERVQASGPHPPLAALGAAYVDYGLANGPLFDLMFSRDTLRTADPVLEDARRRALAPLLQATGSRAGLPVDAIMSWALVHGLVTLARQDALPSDGDIGRTVRSVTARFAASLATSATWSTNMSIT